MSLKDKQWVVYMLKCNDDTIYVGATNDLPKRVKTHNEGKGSKYVKTRLPAVLMAFWECLDKVEAYKLEYKLKKISRIEKLRMIEDYQKD